MYIFVELIVSKKKCRNNNNNDNEININQQPSWQVHGTKSSAMGNTQKITERFLCLWMDRSWININNTRDV